MDATAETNFNCTDAIDESEYLTLKIVVTFEYSHMDKFYIVSKSIEVYEEFHLGQAKLLNCNHILGRAADQNFFSNS